MSRPFSVGGGSLCFDISQASKEPVKICVCVCVCVKRVVDQDSGDLQGGGGQRPRLVESGGFGLWVMERDGTADAGKGLVLFWSGPGCGLSRAPKMVMERRRGLRQQRELRHRTAPPCTLTSKVK
jgi:hypothetical protein